MDLIGLAFYSFLTTICFCIVVVCFYLLKDFMDIRSWLFRYCLAFIILTILVMAGSVVLFCSLYKIPNLLGYKIL